jgi:hypothetical protein
MRLVTFVPKRGAAPGVGLVRDGEQVVDLAQAGSRPPFDPADMGSLIAAGPKALAWLRKAAKAKKWLPLPKVRLLAPLPRPRKNVFCVGWKLRRAFPGRQGGARARGRVSGASGVLLQGAEHRHRPV